MVGFLQICGPLTGHLRAIRVSYFAFERFMPELIQLAAREECLWEWEIQIPEVSVTSTQGNIEVIQSLDLPSIETQYRVFTSYLLIFFSITFNNVLSSADTSTDNFCNFTIVFTTFKILHNNFSDFYCCLLHFYYYNNLFPNFDATPCLLAS